MKSKLNYTRRVLFGALASISLLFSVGLAFAEKVKVAGIYTLPVEQQWISRIHKALNAASDRGEVDYVFSENCCRFQPASQTLQQILNLAILHLLPTREIRSKVTPSKFVILTAVGVIFRIGSDLLAAKFSIVPTWIFYKMILAAKFNP